MPHPVPYPSRTNVISMIFTDHFSGPDKVIDLSCLCVRTVSFERCDLDIGMIIPLDPN